MAKFPFNRIQSKSQSSESAKHSPASASSAFQQQLDGLLKQKKYRQALEEIKKARRSQLELEFKPPEAQIWLLRGQQEFEKKSYKEAESSFRRALELGAKGEPHYWIARCLLSLNRLDAALDLVRTAFEQGELPKEFSICYAKLLFLKGDTAAVEALIRQQPKQFPAMQLRWIQGMLALQQEQPAVALELFKKIKKPITPGDAPSAWIAYTQMVQEDWEAASRTLGTTSPLRSSLPFPTFVPLPTQPILRSLALELQARSGDLPVAAPLNVEPQKQDAIAVLQMLQLIDQGNVHDAGHALLKVKPRSPSFLELQSLRPHLLTLAGQQALQQGQMECAASLWEPLLQGSQFDPQLAINLDVAYFEADLHQERQRLLTRLIKWLEQEARKNPQAWPEQRFKRVLADLQCRLADTWVALGRPRAALGVVQQAEKADPTSPEVIGRKGLIALMEDRTTEAIHLLTQALEAGCQYDEVYQALVNILDEQGDKQTKANIRQRFGKKFGDLNIEVEVEVEHWIDALSTQDYDIFSHLVEAHDEPDPPIAACQFFVDAAQGNMTSTGRTSIDQKAAVEQWDALLQDLSLVEQVPVLQAIVLSLHLFAKRDKGIAGLMTRYINQLAALADEVPEAKLAYLVSLTVKEANANKVKAAIQPYLNSQPQAGNALAEIQLQVRRFAQTITLRGMIDAALSREPQNPLLLLAKATTYTPTDLEYEKLREAGFDLARRLQDAKALQAFREEQAYLTARDAQELLPDPDAFENFAPEDMEAFMEAMIRKMFGGQIPKAELDRVMPELKRRMREEMFNSFPPDADEEFEEGFPIFDLPNPSKGRGRRNFFDL